MITRKTGKANKLLIGWKFMTVTTEHEKSITDKPSAMHQKVIFILRKKKVIEEMKNQELNRIMDNKTVIYAYQ